MKPGQGKLEPTARVDEIGRLGARNHKMGERMV